MTTVTAGTAAVSVTVTSLGRPARATRTHDAAVRRLRLVTGRAAAGVSGSGLGPGRYCQSWRRRPRPPDVHRDQLGAAPAAW